MRAHPQSARANALTLDQIQPHYAVGLTNFYSGPLPTVVVADPAAATNYAGRAAIIVLTADGTTPLSYQWFKGNTAIPNATNDFLSGPNNAHAVEAPMALFAAIFYSAVCLNSISLHSICPFATGPVGAGTTQHKPECPATWTEAHETHAHHCDSLRRARCTSGD